MNNLEEKKKLSSQLKKNPQTKSSKITFYDYEVSNGCSNEDSFGYVCLKCGQCGRKFVDGVLQKEGKEYYLAHHPTEKGGEG